MMERKAKALELKQALDEANAKAAELDQLQSRISALVSAGKTIHHKTFGSGTVVSVDGNRFTIDFEKAGQKDLGISVSIGNGGERPFSFHSSLISPP